MCLCLRSAAVLLNSSCVFRGFPKRVLDHKLPEGRMSIKDRSVSLYACMSSILSQL